MRIPTLFLAALLLIWLPPHLFAQSTAEIRGVVTDASGGVLTGVTFTLTNDGTGLQRTTVSDSGGRFNFPSLPVGSYGLNAKLQGFRQFATSNVRLNAEDIRQVNVVMPVGELSETVNVSGAVEAVQTVGGSLSAVVDEKRIQELPLNGRDPLQLQLLLPGVVTGTGSNRTSP